MFDLEKFKTGKYYVHLPTEEIYDEVMEFLDDNGFKWRSGDKMNYKNIWSRENKNTTITFDNVSRGGVYVVNLRKLLNNEFKDLEGLKELHINLNKQDKLKEIFAVGRLHTDIIKDYIDYKFEEAIMEEAVKVNNIIPNSNIEFIKSIELDGEGDSLVKSPNHYIGELGLEVEEVLRNFIPRYEDAYVAHRVASAIEYLLRSPLKNGTQDLEKARYNIGQALEHIRENKEK